MSGNVPQNSMAATQLTAREMHVIEPLGKLYAGRMADAEWTRRRRQVTDRCSTLGGGGDA